MLGLFHMPRKDCSFDMACANLNCLPKTDNCLNGPGGSHLHWPQVGCHGGRAQVVLWRRTIRLHFPGLSLVFRDIPKLFHSIARLPELCLILGISWNHWAGRVRPPARLSESLELDVSLVDWLPNAKALVSSREISGIGCLAPST